MRRSTMIAQLRPPMPDLDDEWSSLTLQAIVAQEPGRPTWHELDDMSAATFGRRRRRGRRAALAMGVAATAAFAVVTVPVLDSGDAVAADLHDLSQAAVTSDDPVLREGTWLHIRSESLQRNSETLNDGRVLDTLREEWLRWDGRVLLIEQRPSEGWTSYDVVDNNFAPSYEFPTPAFAQTLPDDAAGLRAYLDSRVSGSSSHAEALFEALTSLATSHTLPTRTLAAAYEALADVDDVHTSDVRIGGRPAIEISYDEGLTSSTDSMTVDRATGRVLSSSQRSLQSDYTSTTTLSEVVDAVPSTVLAAFREHDEGALYDATGQPILR